MEPQGERPMIAAARRVAERLTIMSTDCIKYSHQRRGVALSGERSSMPEVAAPLPAAAPRRVGNDRPAAPGLANHLLPVS